MHLQAGDTLVQAVQAEMEAMRGQYQQVVAELQAKVRMLARGLVADLQARR